jgi:ATP-dependent DNA helicase RecG
LTLYGDLDLSILDEMPPGRRKVKTWVVPGRKREAAYDWIRSQILDLKSQVFIICPLIEQSESLASVKAAKVEYEKLKTQVFPSLKLGLLHGRMKARGKEKILASFRQKKLDILVATPVVEVGIDAPNATIMIIEGAERFGLAQLHQLRGRVGRGAKQSYCFLFTEVSSPKVIKRLKSLERLHIGAKLAELDLEMRGPGEIYGTVQHGFASLEVASLSDLSLIEKARKAAKMIFTKDPRLEIFPQLKEKLKWATITQVEPD